MLLSTFAVVIGFLDDGFDFGKTGCTNERATNYDSSAETDDSSCHSRLQPEPLAGSLYDEEATVSDGSCPGGCTTESALNYDSLQPGPMAPA